MGKRSSGWGISSFLLVGFLFLQLGLIAAQNRSPWLTLKGNAPAIIAKGGLSGLFPDSSSYAYELVSAVTSNATTLWCDVRLTNDSTGICLPNLDLNNCTNIQGIYPQGKSTYSVNGQPVTGWFSVDYKMSDLQSVYLIQAILSRTYRFGLFSIIPVDAFQTQFNSNTLWLNIQHDMFYQQHNLNMTSYVLSITRSVAVSYLSSPEVVFLRGIAPRFSNTRTKLIFRFLDKTMTEPSTNQTYGALLNNLTFIKTFASGILVPKNYISVITADNYVQSYSTVVTDAHKAGLEIYAADFANDNIFCYNYSYDPLTEQLAFIDNGQFAVDGVLTDFPLTTSMAIGCFSQLNNSIIDHGKPLVISHNGASGDYPDCTDLAYRKAVADGADFIDCAVQVTRDGILICMSSVNLIAPTTVTKSKFSSRLSTILQLQKDPGIFTFNLTWDEIQSLKPTISQPESGYSMVRNPRYRNSGNFMNLSDFLTFAKKESSLSGILIRIEYAAFMAQQLSIDAVNSVISALNDAGYNETTLEVMIQSTDSSVLVKFKQLTKYKRVYEIDKLVRAAIASSVKDIQSFADAVVLGKRSIYPTTDLFTTGETGLVDQLQAAGLDVYTSLFQNEFVSQAWDYYSDATAEINTFVLGAKVDGIITDYPATASRYKRNKCRSMGNNSPNYIKPFEPGQLFQLMASDSLPPALAPMPPLTDTDVIEPPLPPARKAVAPAATPPPKPSSGQRCIVPLFVPLLMMVCGFLLLA